MGALTEAAGPTHADLRAYACQLRDADEIANGPIWEAISQHGGLVPDMMWNPRRGVHGSYELSGEYADVPERFLVIPEAGTRSVYRGARLDGNADEICQTIRFNIGSDDYTDGELRDFLRNYRRKPLSEYVEDARQTLGDPIPVDIANAVAVVERLDDVGFVAAGADTDGKRALYVLPDTDVVVSIGPRTVAVRGVDIADAYESAYRMKSGAWTIFPTSDVRTVARAMAAVAGTA